MAASIEELIDELYAAPLGDFVARRSERARSLRQGGDREAAAEVKALRKPSVSAWAVNQLVRREERRLAALLAAGNELRAAQLGLLEGGSQEALAQASAAEREALGRLTDAARGILEEAGESTSGTTLERIRETLHAAAVDDDVAELVRAGRLEKEQQAPSFPFAGLRGAPPAAAAKRPERDRKKETRLRSAREEHRLAEARLDEARRNAEEAETEMQEQQRILARAERRLGDRRAELERAEREVERARAAVDRYA